MENRSFRDRSSYCVRSGSVPERLNHIADEVLGTTHL